MDRSLRGVRMMKFRDVFGRCEEGRLSRLEAAELLGIRSGRFPAGVDVTRRRV